MFDWLMNVHFIFITSLRVSALQVEESCGSWCVGAAEGFLKVSSPAWGLCPWSWSHRRYLASHGGAEKLTSLHFFVVIKLNRFDLMYRVNMEFRWPFFCPFNDCSTSCLALICIRSFECYMNVKCLFCPEICLILTWGCVVPFLCQNLTIKSFSLHRFPLHFLQTPVEIISSINPP